MLGLKLFPTRSSHRPPAAAAPQPAGIPPTISEMDGDGDDGKWDAHTQRLTPSSLKMYSSQQPTLSSPVPMSIMGVSGGGGGASRLLEMQQKIEQLEAAVLASEEIVQFERQRSKDALQRAVHTYIHRDRLVVCMYKVVLYMYVCRARLSGPCRRCASRSSSGAGRSNRRPPSTWQRRCSSFNRSCRSCPGPPANPTTKHEDCSSCRSVPSCHTMYVCMYICILSAVDGQAKYVQKNSLNVHVLFFSVDLFVGRVG